MTVHYAHATGTPVLLTLTLNASMRAAGTPPAL